LRGELIVLDAFRHRLIGSADRLATVIGAHGIMAAPIEGEEGISQRGYVGRKKTRRADVKVHLIAVTINRGALDGTIRRVVGTVQGMGWS
jgi:hypothetical protein